jgi:8-oxo-dGTP diphosphatase
VRLHFLVVSRWRGEPCSREGQAFSWQQPGAVAVGPLLPASVPVIERLAAAAAGSP